MGEKAICARCGEPAKGYAYIGDKRYCHGDQPKPSCYMKQLWEGVDWKAINGELGR